METRPESTESQRPYQALVDTDKSARPHKLKTQPKIILPEFLPPKPWYRPGRLAWLGTFCMSFALIPLSIGQALRQLIALKPLVALKTLAGGLLTFAGMSVLSLLSATIWPGIGGKLIRKCILPAKYDAKEDQSPEGENQFTYPRHEISRRTLATPKGCVEEVIVTPKQTFFRYAQEVNLLGDEDSEKKERLESDKYKDNKRSIRFNEKNGAKKERLEPDKYTIHFSGSNGYLQKQLTHLVYHTEQKENGIATFPSYPSIHAQTRNIIGVTYPGVRPLKIGDYEPEGADDLVNAGIAKIYKLIRVLKNKNSWNENQIRENLPHHIYLYGPFIRRCNRTSSCRFF